MNEACLYYFFLSGCNAANRWISQPQHSTVMTEPMNNTPSNIRLSRDALLELDRRFKSQPPATGGTASCCCHPPSEASTVSSVSPDRRVTRARSPRSVVAAASLGDPERRLLGWLLHDVGRHPRSAERSVRRRLFGHPTTNDSQPPVSHPSPLEMDLLLQVLADTEAATDDELRRRLCAELGRLYDEQRERTRWHEMRRAMLSV